MSTIAENNLRSAEQMAKSIQDVVRSIFLAIAEMIEANDKYAAQKELARYIREGGGMHAYEPCGGCGQELKARLEQKGIPYIECANKTLFVRDTDLDQIVSINRDVLIAKGNYFQEVEQSELERSVSNNNEKKEVFTIHGLDRYEMESLKNKCNDITRGFMVGVARHEDGTYDLTVQGDRLFRGGDKKGADFCKAFVASSFSLYGLNHEIKAEQLKADWEVEEHIAKMRSSENAIYVVGVDEKDPKNFIEINDQYFEHYQSYVDENGKRKERLLERCSLDDPNYDSELQKCMDGIFNKAILDNQEELGKHLMSDERNINTQRPYKSMDQIHISTGERKIGQIIDKMVSGKLMGKEPTNAYETFNAYIKEVRDLLSAAAEGGPAPKGYSAKNLEKLRYVADKYGLNLAVYKNAIEKSLDGKYKECHIAGREKTRSADLDMDRVR